MKRKILALLGMTIVSAGAATYMSIKEMKQKTKSVLINHKEVPETEQKEETAEENPVEQTEREEKSERIENNMVPSRCGALHVEGKTLLDEHDKPVQLKGISTHGLAWYPQYVNAEFIRELREKWNANVLRLAMYTAEESGYCTDGDKEQLKQLVRDGVKFATENDLYVIIDWHILSDFNPHMHKEEAIAFFDEMSAEFAAHKNVLYELCNEPNGETSWDEIRSYAEEVIPVIRAHAPEAVILVGTPFWSQRVDEAVANPLSSYGNIMYTLHFYAGTHKEVLRSNMISAIIAGLPIFVSEFGICDASGNGALDYESAQAWLDTLNAYNISYVMWNLGNKDESSCVIKADCEKTSGFTAEDLNDSGKWLYHVLTGEELS